MRAIPPEIFYGLPPRQNQLNPEPLTLSDLSTIQTVDTTGREEPRRHSSAVTGNPSPGMTTSSRYNPFNSANVTSVLSYSSKSDAPIIRTWKLTDIEAFEQYCKDSRIFLPLNGEAWRALRNVPDSYDGCTLCHHQYESVVKAITQGNDKDHCDFMVSKFQYHMEDGLFHTPVTDILDIGDRI